MTQDRGTLHEVAQIRSALLIIETERLVLRPLRMADAEPTAALMSPAIARWTGSWTGRDSVQDVRDRIERDWDRAARGQAFDRAVTLKDGGALIGWIGVRRLDDDSRRGAIGYWFGEAYFGRGYAKEAARAVLDAAWTALDIDHVEGAAQVANAGSLAILAGLGMRRIGQRPEYAPARRAADLCDWYEIQRPA
jgi:ribosomal-protein-alanine N-acetyltransferase